MPRNVQFNDKTIDEAQAVAPSFEFSLFAQSAVREKIEKMRNDEVPDVK